MRALLLLLVLLGLAAPLAAQRTTADTEQGRLMLILAREARPFFPPTEYRVWWDELVRVCGASDDCRPQASFSDLLWHAVPGEHFACGVGNVCLGWWWSDNTVFIAAGQRNKQTVVQHEMLHALLGRADHKHGLFRRYPSEVRAGL